MSAPPGGDPADLSAWLRTRWLGRSSVYHEVIGSTQDEARRLAAEGAPHGLLVWAGEQTAGRGRQAREWQSAAGAGLWFSVVVRPGLAAERVAPLPLAVGAAVGAALHGMAPGRIALKWPNDVLLDGAKVAGILVEGHAAGGLMDHAVIGVGINLSRPSEGFAAEIASTAAALADATGSPPSPVRTLAAVLGHLESAYEALIADGPASARDQWLDLADTIGRDVVARAGGTEIRGRAIDLDEGGNLVIDVNGEPHVISFGEIEHLRPTA